MIRSVSRATWTAAAILAVGFGVVVTASSAGAMGLGHPVAVADNYYAPPGTPSGVGAQMYPAPRYVPPLVGYTAITYPPFAPQKDLYHHHELHVNGPTAEHAHYGGWNVSRNVHWFFHGLPNRSTVFQ